MDKLEYFIKALNAGRAQKRAWLIKIFGMLMPQALPDVSNPEVQKTLKEWDLYFDPTGYYTVDPAKPDTLVKITADPKKPFCYPTEKVSVKKNALANISADMDTTYGRLLFNQIAIVYPFQSKVGFFNKNTSPSEVEQVILDSFADDVPVEEQRPDQIYVSEYLKYANAAFYLTGLTQLIVPAGTPKSMTTSPENEKLKQRLLLENKDRLHDPAVIADIAKQLVDYDKNVWLKDDDSLNFLLQKKSFSVVRSKLYLMHGAERGMQGGVDVDLITNSLTQGWDVKKFHAMNNNMRYGSQSRGAETMKGGEEVKWIFRAASNIVILPDTDCGAILGMDHQITEGNKKRFIGMFMIVDKKPVKITKDNLDSLVGTTVILRSTQFCLSGPKTDYCSTCCGDQLSVNPKAAASFCSDTASTFLNMYMAGAHGKALEVARMNFTETMT